MSDKLLEQADSLMRRRSFVAGAKTLPSDATGPTELAEDAALADVPVLTDVVGVATSQARDETMAPADTMLVLPVEAIVRERLDQLLSTRQAELAQEIETWLDEQMPQLVIRAMDGITDHLVALLANRARDELLPRLEAALRLSDEESADAAKGE